MARVICSRRRTRGDGMRGDRGVGQGERRALHGARRIMLSTAERQLVREERAHELQVPSRVIRARARAAAVRAVVALLEGPASRQYLAIAERRESYDAERAGLMPLPPGLSARVRSFSALSTTLGISC